MIRKYDEKLSSLSPVQVSIITMRLKTIVNVHNSGFMLFPIKSIQVKLKHVCLLDCIGKTVTMHDMSLKSDTYLIFWH